MIATSTREIGELPNVGTFQEPGQVVNVSFPIQFFMKSELINKQGPHSGEALTRDQIDQFREEGVVILRNCIPPEALDPLVEELKRRVEQSIRAAVEKGFLDLEHTFPDAPFATRLALASKYCHPENWIWKNGFYDQKPVTAGVFILRKAAPILDITESLIGGEILAHPQYSVRAKMPDHEETAVPWHQDVGYLNTKEAGETLVVNFWIPLVAATVENGCLQVIPGTHQLGDIPHQKLSVKGKANLAVRDEDLPDGEILSCEVEVGDAILLNERILHRSVPNLSETVRWSIDTRYSQIGLPTGRAKVPGFIARSRRFGDTEVDSVGEWKRILAENDWKKR